MKLFAVFFFDKMEIQDMGKNVKQDWVAFMSQPYYVEVKVEVDIENEVDLRLRLK